MTVAEASVPGTERGEHLLAVRNLQKHYPIKEGALQRVAGHVKAVDGVDFDLMRGETLGLVGESGCGKTTLGRMVSGLIEPSAGGVYFDLSPETASELDQLLSGTESDPARLATIERSHRIDKLDGARWQHFRRNCQMVFQDSFASLNPRHLVNDIVGRPLRVHKEASGAALTEKVVELLEMVGLGRQHLYRYPHQFSGGQRQRISIARALALDPELIVLDEPTSALDVSVQAQILNLLHDLQRERNLTYLFITHDLSVVRHMADRIVVMYLGKVAEAGPTDELFAQPLHPYTDALLKASPDVEAEEGFRGLEGSVPDPAHPPQGCRFHTRCPLATPECGWEVDDVVRWLEDDPRMFETLSGVERHSPFHADLSFDAEEAAAALVEAIESDRVPRALRGAMAASSRSGANVTIRFHPVDEVKLERRGSNRLAACVLDRLP